MEAYSWPRQIQDRDQIVTRVENVRIPRGLTDFTFSPGAMLSAFRYLLYRVVEHRTDPVPPSMRRRSIVHSGGVDLEASWKTTEVAGKAKTEVSR